MTDPIEEAAKEIETHILVGCGEKTIASIIHTALAERDAQVLAALRAAIVIRDSSKREAYFGFFTGYTFYVDNVHWYALVSALSAPHVANMLKENP